MYTYVFLTVHVTATLVFFFLLFLIFPSTPMYNLLFLFFNPRASTSFFLQNKNKTKNMYETNNDTRSRRRRRKCLIIPLFHYFFYCDIFVPFSAQFFVRHQLKMCTVYYISCANCLLPLHPSYCYNFWTCFWKVNTSTITSMNVFFGCYDGKLLL